MRIAVFLKNVGVVYKAFAACGDRICSFETHHFRNFAKRNFENDVSLKILWGCVKSLLPPAAAEYSSERHVIFTISRSEISKMMCRLKYYGVV
jgi:hypothetical protein